MPSQRARTAWDLARFDAHNDAPQSTAAENGPAAGAAASMIAEAERIAATLEPELKQVIDTTMEQVAEIEDEALRDIRELTQRADRDAQAALDRSARLVGSLETLTRTVAEVTSALRADMDDVIDSLQRLREVRIDVPEAANTAPIQASQSR